MSVDELIAKLMTMPSHYEVVLKSYYIGQDTAPIKEVEEVRGKVIIN